MFVAPVSPQQLRANGVVQPSIVALSWEREKGEMVGAVFSESFATNGNAGGMSADPVARPRPFRHVP